MSKFQFDEDYAKQYDEVDSRTCDFPFDEVCARLDGAKAECGTDWATMSAALKKLLLYFGQPCLGKGVTDAALKESGKRLTAALWVLNNGAFDGTPSGRELSRRIGYNSPIISALASDFTATFGVRNRAQAHGRNGEHAAKLHKADATDSDKVSCGAPAERQLGSSNAGLDPR